MYRIIIKYRNGKKDDVIEEQDYCKARKIANAWGGNIESIHFKEIK